MEQPVKRWTPVAVILIAITLLGVVGLAARPNAASAGVLEPPGEVTRVLLDTAFYLAIVVVVLFVGLCIWALWPDPNAPQLALPARRSWLWLLVPVTVAGVAAVALSRLRLGSLAGRLPAGSGAGGPGAVRPGSGLGAFTGFDWLALGLVVVMVGATALAAYARLRRRSLGAGREWRLADALEHVFDDAVDDVLGESDPRRAVIAAYARMERVLGSAGLPRRDSEAPLEYVARARAELELPAAMTRLADLYEWARFSPHQVAAPMREEALAALVAIRDQLRELRDRREQPVAV